MAAKKKRSVIKASARTSSRKGGPARKPTAQSQPRKAKPAARAPAKTRPKAVRTKRASTPTAKGIKAISRKKPVVAAKTPQTAAKVATRISASVPAQRQLPMRRVTNSPLTSSVGLIHGIPPYQPKPGEQYMSERQLEHFGNILLAWKRELMEEVDRTVHHMQDEASNFPDPNDRATQESEFGLELRTRDRERKLLKKIESALARIDEGTYGYCEETGEEIGLKRLEARPVATLSVEAQERRELAERQFRDREDAF